MVAVPLVTIPGSYFGLYSVFIRSDQNLTPGDWPRTYATACGSNVLSESRYGEELRRLSDIYRGTRDGNGQLDELVKSVAVRPTCFVGSGGALAVATVAADLHRRRTGRVALALTPLQAARGGLLREAGIVVFSAGARHPDTALAIDAGRLGGYRPIYLVTCRDPAEIPRRLIRDPVRVVQVAAPRDGFLATGSVLAMATALCRAYGWSLPELLPALDVRRPIVLPDRCIVLTGPSHGAIAVDLETRLSETGLSSAQQTDYRNFAHGRHVGLARNVETTAVIALIDPDSTAIAERVLRLLPSEVRTYTIRSQLPFPGSVLDLLVESMHVVDSPGNRFDPAKPNVRPFGRKLYRMPVLRALRPEGIDPVHRKLHAGGMSTGTRAAVQQALSRWLGRAQQEPIDAIVLDYDGTCCTTVGRFDPPPREIRDQLSRLCDTGIPIAFASGRGRSLVEQARAWLPQEVWPNVTVGLYNGGILMKLAEEIPTVPQDLDILAAAERLETADAIVDLVTEPRATQVSVSTTAAIDGRSLASIVATILSQPPQIRCSVVASAHSVDVIPKHVSKLRVLEAIAPTESRVLAIGDQGHPGGNDFDLLAATELSLSVDRVSPDLTRCWNLDDRGNSGPGLLARYLKALRILKKGVYFRWGR